MLRYNRISTGGYHVAKTKIARASRPANTRRNKARSVQEAYDIEKRVIREESKRTTSVHKDRKVPEPEFPSTREQSNYHCIAQPKGSLWDQNQATLNCCDTPSQPNSATLPLKQIHNGTNRRIGQRGRNGLQSAVSHHKHKRLISTVGTTCFQTDK